MTITKQLSEKCKNCPRVNVCNEKRMEACAYMEMSDAILASTSSPSADSINIKSGPNITLNIGPLDIEEAKKQLERNICKAMYGQCPKFGV